MVHYTPKPWWVAVGLLLWALHTTCAEFTPEDMKVAIQSLLNRMRRLEDKIERHDFKENVQFRKMFNIIEKSYVETLKLDGRLSKLETILLQKEEREKASQVKINDTLVPPTPSEDLGNKLSVPKDALETKSDATGDKIDDVKKEIISLKNGLSPESLRSMFLEVVSKMNPFEKHISEAEKLLNKYELKLNEFNGPKAQNDFVPLNKGSLADEAWHSKMSEAMERQEKETKKIQQLLSDAESTWKDLPRLADIHRSTNQTIESITNATQTVLRNNEIIMERQDKETKKIQQLLSDAETTWKDLPRIADVHRSNTQTIENVNNATETMLSSNKMVMDGQEKETKKIQQLFSVFENKWKDLPGLADLYRSTNQTIESINNATKSMFKDDQMGTAQLTINYFQLYKERTKIQQLLSGAESTWKDLLRRTDLHRSANETIQSVNNATLAMVRDFETVKTKMETTLREMGDRVISTNVGIHQSLNHSSDMTERAYKEITRIYESLLAEVQLLSTCEDSEKQANNTEVANQKRVENGKAHRILMEIHNMNKTLTDKLCSVEMAVIGNQTGTLNGQGSAIIMEMSQVWRQIGIMHVQITNKLDNIETPIIANQTPALYGIGAKIMSEASQIWRQIGIIHQQIIKSQEVLNKLSETSKQNVNSNATTIDEVKKEVTGITTRVVELGENLNLVLGQLSLVTQDIKKQTVERHANFIGE